MSDQNTPLQVMEVMARFLELFTSNVYKNRDDVAIYVKKKKLTLYIPDPDQTDATLVRVTKLDDTAVSIMVYRESERQRKLYMTHYNLLGDSEEKVMGELLDIGREIYDAIHGTSEAAKAEPPEEDAHPINVEDIVRITSVETLRVTEHHVLSVGFDGQAPVNMAIPKEQLGAFVIGNKLIRMPYGFQFLENNPILH